MTATGGASTPDRWLVLRVPRPPDEDVRDLFVEELLSLGTRGVEEREDTLVVYLARPEADADAVAASLSTRLAGISGELSIPVEGSWQPQEAWEDRWRTHFRPRAVTDRITVAPSWDRPQTSPGGILVTIDPGMAFGTSDHPTTRGCLRLLDLRVQPGDRIADVGSGSGILAITAALLGADTVLAVELDPWACAAARENVERNGVGDRVTVRAAPVTPEGLPGEAPFDGIVSNIESGILGSLLPGLRAALDDGGWMILSGILRSEAESIIGVAGAQGFELGEVDVEGDWWTGEFMVRR